MDVEDSFYTQLGRTIQSWLWVEAELYRLYALLMRDANSHLISATFNNVQSVDAKLGLLNACLALVLPKEAPEWKLWRSAFNKAEKLNKKRNKVVHEPVVVSVSKGLRTVAISLSHFNALALVKGQTTHQGTAVSASYKPSQAKVLVDHTIDLSGLHSLERTFKEFSFELREFHSRVEPLVQPALSATNKKRGAECAT
jgi:hypothetical protein